MLSYTAVAIIFLQIVIETPKKWHTNITFDQIISSISEEPNGKYILNCGTWGCYFGNSLLMQKTAVVWADTDEERGSLLDIAKKQGASIIHLCHNCGESEVAKLYEGSPISLYESQKSDFGEWRAFKIK